MKKELLKKDLKYIRNITNESYSSDGSCYNGCCPLRSVNAPEYIKTDKHFNHILLGVKESWSGCAAKAFSLCKVLGWHGTIEDFKKEFITVGCLNCGAFFKFLLKMPIRNTKI